MLARGNENFCAPGEHGFSFFQVKMFTGSVSVLLTSSSLKIKKLKLAEATRETEHRIAMHSASQYRSVVHSAGIVEFQLH